MKKSMSVRFFVSLLLVFSMLSPIYAAAAFDDGKKHFQAGMKHEDAQAWDKAVEEFALAVADSPKNPEYRLHLARSLFNASQMYMKKGTASAKEKDYEAGYLAFRRAYAFDPTNELAKSEMERMVRLQQEINENKGDAPDKKSDPTKVKMVTAGYTAPASAPQMPQKLEKLRDLPFPAGVDLQFIIKELARDLELNVLFDSESFRQKRTSYIDLKNVSAARALDYLFLQEGLFFQKVGPRTIIVATQNQRQKFQQLVLRTFYLANAAPKDVVKVIQTAIPAQPGRSQTTVLPDDTTNSITVRDTEENIRLIGQLIKSLDKDRAEVVMDVAIYEVNKNDLLQIGNQIGNQAQLTSLGGSQIGQVPFGSKPLAAAAAAGAAAAASIPTAIVTGIVLPSMNISAFQNKNDTKLLAFSQIHAFNNENSEARIGQRVPVRSATFQTGVANNVGGGGIASDVINYEQVGLTLKFKPLVFPNQDVQVEMEIESKDVSGAQTLTPTFTERKIKGTARIQNNKTLLLASVAQDVESNGRAGLPLLGLIPIIGRLFSTPTKDNRKVDLVIAVTPRVIRAPAILPEDEIERPTGSMAVPTNASLEAMVIEEDRQELLAAARRLSNESAVQLPDRPAETGPEYVQTATTAVAQTNTAADSDLTTPEALAAAIPNLKPADKTVEKPSEEKTAETATAKTEPSIPGAAVELRLGTELAEMKAGEKVRIPVVMEGSGAFKAATMGLVFDPAKVAVRKVTFGDAFGEGVSNTVLTPFLNENGKMYATLTVTGDKTLPVSGTLAYIEIEALSAGKPVITFDRDLFNFQTLSGKNFVVKFQE